MRQFKDFFGDLQVSYGIEGTFRIIDQAFGTMSDLIDESCKKY